MKQHEDKLRQLVELSPVPMAIHELGTISLVNRAAAELIGAKNPQELVGMNVLRFVHPDSVDTVKKRIALLAEGKRKHTLRQEEKLIRMDGEVIIVEIVSILVEYGGKPSIQLIFHDISKHRRSEEDLSYTNSLLTTVMDNASLALLMMDDRHHCTFMNRAAESITGYTFTEIQQLDKPLHDIIHHTHPDGRPYPMAECPIDRALPKRNREKGEGVFVRRDGTFYPVRFTASPILKARKPVGTIIELEDLTERLQKESVYAEATKRRAELEEITAALKEKQTELEALNQSKDEFISLASHQLRTPATGVKQYIAMALEGYAGELSPKLRTFLEQAYASNERQLTIVNDLLKVAQVDAGKVLLEREDVDIVNLVSEIIRDYTSKLHERQQKVILQKSASSVVIKVDELRMRMVIENIIDNASKYTPRGKTITVGVSQLKTKVRISVKDEGVGIDQSATELIFQKFTRLDNPLSMQVGGTGLGLYWAKKIVDLHGGKITVRSKIGQGSTFVIYLPHSRSKGK